MTTQLPSLPSADLTRLRTIRAQDLVLAALAFERAATARALGRLLKPWGVETQQTSGALATLGRGGLAEAAGERWLATPAGEAQAAEHFDVAAQTAWPAFAERQFTALVLGLDPKRPGVRTYLASARNFYAGALAVLFDLADPAAHPKLNAMRAALVWRIAAARCPDLINAEAPSDMTGPIDALTRALYVRFSGLPGGTVDQATPALLRRVLPGAAVGVGGLRRGLVRAALKAEPMHMDETDNQLSRAPEAQSRQSQPTAAGDFAKTIIKLARTLKTPKAKGGYFTGGQVAIAQVYDAYAEQGHPAMTLDAFKSRLWEAIRGGADFHLTRLDIPSLMDDGLRKRSATPTRAGDVVHFIVLD